MEFFRGVGVCVIFWVIGISVGLIAAKVVHHMGNDVQTAVMVPCDTDTDCMLKNGGDGGPMPRRRQ